MTRRQSAVARRVLAYASQALFGLLIVIAIGFALRVSYNKMEQARLPEGWMIIRPPSEVCTIELVDGEVWTGGKDGLVIIDGESGERLGLPAGTPSFGYVHDLLRDSRQRIWVAHDGGLARYQDRAWTDFDESTAVGLKRALSLLEDRLGRIWVGIDGGVLILGADRFAPVKLPAQMKIASADALFQDSDGAVWVGCASPSHGALWRSDGGTWEQFGVDEGLPHPAVNMITQDSAGAVWVATGFANNGGAAVLRDGHWQAVTKSDGLAGWKVRSIYEDHAGRLWFGSEYDGVAVSAGSGFIRIPPHRGLAGNEVKVTVQDANGVYWLGTDTGLSRVQVFEEEQSQGERQ